LKHCKKCNYNQIHDERLSHPIGDGVFRCQSRESSFQPINMADAAFSMLDDILQDLNGITIEEWAISVADSICSC